MNTFEEIQKLRGELNRLEKLAREVEIKKLAKEVDTEIAKLRKNCIHDFEVFPCGCKKCKKCGLLVRANLLVNWKIVIDRPVRSSCTYIDHPMPRFFI